jgi:zinc protease
MSPQRALLACCVGLAAAVLPVSAAGDTVQTFAVDAATTGALVKDHRAPLVRVVVEFPVGTWSAWAEGRPLEEAWRAQLYDPQGSLRRRGDRLAADIGLQVGERSASIRASCLAEDLPAVMELIGDVLANRALDRDELRRWRKERKLGWEAAQREPQFRLNRAIVQAVFRPGDARRESVAEPEPVVTDPERLLALRDEVVRLPGRVVGFAGALTLEQAKGAAAGLLPEARSSAPDGLEPRLLPPVPLDRRPAEQVVEVPRIQQVFFGLTRVSLDYRDPRYPAFLVADHALGGHFYSRLYVALRHEGGETYGARTRGPGGAAAEAYALTTFTGTANAPVAEAKLRGVLEQFHRDGLTEEERAAAAGYLVGRIPFAHQSPAQELGRWLVERRAGLPAGTIDRLARAAADVPLAEVNAFVEEFYDPELFRLVRAAPAR